MPGCIVSATTASFRSVEKRRRRAMPVITSTFENVSDIGVCLGLCLGPPANAGVRSKRGAVHEDNELSLMLLKDFLEHNGYTILATSLGETAIELARQYRPNLILMDIQLPDISGTEAARQLKADEQTRTIPIIAVTAFAMSGDEAKILGSGCDAYISKPFNLVEFLALVARYIGQDQT